MDMKELFESGCFTPEWTEQEAVYREDVPIPERKDLDKLYEELAEIKENIEDLQERKWYLARKMEYFKHGFSQT